MRTLAGCVSMLVMLCLPGGATAAESNVQFQRLTLCEDFHSEGADFADFNGDGHNDVVSGPFWYQGPEFRIRHRYTGGDRFSITDYSKHFFTFAHDFSGDGLPDLLVIGMPGEAAHWYQNPGDASSRSQWQQHLVMDDVGGESPEFADLTGDGKPELICVSGGRFGFAEPNWQQATEVWTFTPVSADRGYGRFTHGLGIGDLDQDGRLDVLETNGWYQAPPQSGQPFVFQPQEFAESGGSQMHAYDFDGDGDQDVVSVQNAHGWGLTWFERRGAGDDMLWVAHPILTAEPGKDGSPPAISQMHALALADIDGDGVDDLVTGKRYFAHGGGDPGAFQPAVLYWLQTIRDAHGVRFQPHLIDRHVGVGTQLTVGDVNGDGRNDVIVGNKLGTSVLVNQGTSDREPTPFAGIEPGTADFARSVRESPPLTPEAEGRSFLLPPGFEVQLVAAEPDIAKPLNMAFDAHGRLWVTCTVEYPYAVEPDKPGRDSIKILEDHDGDGRADQVTTFADGLNIPIGLYPYQDGVICYSIPYIWYLRDTDGDGRCDQREKLYGPFDHTRDVHGMCNAFRRGYDGWLYACHGFSNNSSVQGRDGHQVTMQSGNTFRVRLDGRRIEHFTHGQVNPFGMAYDSRGNLLTADCHTKPVTLLLPGGYYESFGKPHDGLGFVPGVMNHLHGSTAIGGIAVCADRGVFPDSYVDNAFGGNVMTSRVNRNSLIYHGGSVTARQEPDFLVSGDPWFRPVDLRFGPDGALYIADFYNRIIGHYEEPLDHPGRDRTSGRIWRVVYRPSDDRRDQDPAHRQPDPLLPLPRQLPELIAELDSPHQARRFLAADQIVDRMGASAATAARVAYQESSSTRARVELLWVLQRLGMIDYALLAGASQADDPRLRVAAFRVLAEAGFEPDEVRELLDQGLHDPDSEVNRAAVLATSRHIDSRSISGLLDLYRRTAAGDVHLRHCIRMALRDHLQDESTFQATAAQVTADQIDLIAGICLSLRTASAGEFVARHIESLAADDQERVSAYIQLAVAHAAADTATGVVAVARQQFADDQEFQLELLRGLDRTAGNDGLPAAIVVWARDMATQLLAVDQTATPINWTHLPHGPQSGETRIWDVSRHRNSADGQQGTVLWSSFPHGEQRTGIYRSGEFALPADFQFWIAGHDGPPGSPIQGLNLVRLCDARTNEVLRSWPAPRNDTAQQQGWQQSGEESSAHVGRPVYLELVDGDPGNAFAWLAVGRFSVTALNPSDLLTNRRSGADLAARFQLLELRAPIVELARRSIDPQTRWQLAGAAANLQDPRHREPRLEAQADLLLIRSLDAKTISAIIDAISDQRFNADQMTAALRYATHSDQLRVGRRLAASRIGAESLLNLIAAGKMSHRLLSDPEIRSKVEATGSDDDVRKLTELTVGITEEGDAVDTLIQDRQSYVDSHPGDAARGRQLFAKHCTACHKVGGEGKEVGPNLDGIGNRGLARICEDVLAPHRNVDASFRSSTVLTDDGRALVGLIKNETESQLVLIDTSGREHRLDPATIESRKRSISSPMPANFGDLLSQPQFSDLVQFLMSLVH